MKIYRICDICKFVACVAITLILSSVVVRAEASDVSADNAYMAGDFETAIRLWEQEKESNSCNAALYYNLGNAYFKTGNNGAAILNYRKALLLEPSNKQASRNLRYVENQVSLVNQSLLDGKNMDPLPASPGIVDSIELWISDISSNTWAVCSLCLFILAIGCTLIYVYFTDVLWRKIGFFGAIASVLLCAAGIYFAIISKRHALSQQTCVLMSTDSILRSEPTETASQVATPLGAGTVFKVMNLTRDTIGTEWTQVYLNTDYTGWLPSSDVAIVEIPDMRE